MSQPSDQIESIAVGDTTQDVFLQVSDASVNRDVKSGRSQICLDFGEKIAVDKKTDVPAVGNAANNAVGLARLGIKTAIYTLVGDDVQGHIAKTVFEENGVDTRYLVFDKQHGTNFSAVINYQEERTILVYHEPRTYKLPDLVSSQWIYLTSASDHGIKELHEQLMSFLQNNPDVKLAFNPGTHQLNLGQQVLEPLLSRTEILFLNRGESAELLGLPANNIKELIKGFHALGVKIMVLTDGPAGSYASDGRQIYYLDIFRGPVISRTGAGDSFGSGFMGALIKKKDLPAAMLWGNANSTSVVQQIGARAGLLDEPAVLKMIEQNSAIKPALYAKL